MCDTNNGDVLQCEKQLVVYTSWISTNVLQRLTEQLILHLTSYNLTIFTFALQQLTKIYLCYTQQ